MNRRTPTNGTTDEVKDSMSRLTIKLDLESASQRARYEYRRRAVENLLMRIEDAMALVREGKYPMEDALHMIECQCKRVRLIDEELGK